MIAAALGIDPAAVRPGWERSGPRPRLEKPRAAPSFDGLDGRRRVQD
jgi:hypothetical protein